MTKHILLALLLGGAVCALPAAAQVPDIGVAASVTNKVDASVGPQNRPVVIGDKVFQNEVIRTGANSKSQLLFLDETSLSIGPESEVTLDKFVYNGQGGTVSLNATKGVFRFISGSLPKQAYEIKTPSATVGVRGTIIYIGVLADGTSIFYNGEGGFVLSTVFGNFSSSTPGEVIVIRPGGGQPEIGKLKPWQQALFAALLDPDKKSGTVPTIPGMPDKGDQLRNLLRNQEQIINCNYTYSEGGGGNYCGG
jgi:hypothetical protein